MAVNEQQADKDLRDLDIYTLLLRLLGKIECETIDILEGDGIVQLGAEFGHVLLDFVQSVEPKRFKSFHELFLCEAAHLLSLEMVGDYESNDIFGIDL